MILAVAGCVAQAEGDEIAGAGAVRGHRAGPADLSPPAGDGGPRRPGRRAVIETDFPADESSTTCRKQAARQGVTAFLTVQEGCDKFCSLLRGALHPRRRGSRPRPPCWPRRAAWWRGHARDHPARPERERLARRGAVAALAWPPGARAGGHPGPARIRYTTSHPRDMDDDLIAAHARHPGADAVPASAGAIRLGPHAGGDEPPAHRRRLPAPGASGCAPPGRTWRCRRTSSSATPARPRPISRRRWR